jgi:hypothetical protein
MSLALVKKPPVPPSRRDSLRQRVLECLRATTLNSIVSWDDDAQLGRDGTDLWLLAQLIEEEFEIIITVPQLLDLAMAGPTMGRWLDLVEARAHA